MYATIQPEVSTKDSNLKRRQISCLISAATCHFQRCFLWVITHENVLQAPT